MPLVDDFVIQFREGMREQLKREGERLGLDIGRAVEGETTKAAAPMEGKLVGMLKRIGGAIGVYLGVRTLVNFTKNMFEVGSMAEETASKFNTTFGPAAAGASEWLEEFANKAGLSTQAGQDLLATIGAMTQGMGLSKEASRDFSQDILALAGDLQSFHNVPIEETFAAIRSGLVGQSEPMRRFGVLLTEAKVAQAALVETGKSDAKQLTELEKVRARFNIMLRDSGVAVGDLDRTQDSAANTARRLQAQWQDMRVELAQALMPSMREFLAALDRNWESIKGGVTITARGLKFLAEAVIRTGDAFRVTFYPPVVDAVEALVKLSRAAETAWTWLGKIDGFLFGKQAAADESAKVKAIREQANELERWARNMKATADAAQERLRVEGALRSLGALDRAPRSAGGHTIGAPGPVQGTGTGEAAPVVDLNTTPAQEKIKELEGLIKLMAETAQETTERWAQEAITTSAAFLQAHYSDIKVRRVGDLAEERAAIEAVVQAQEEKSFTLRRVSADEAKATLDHLEKEFREREQMAEWRAMEEEDRQRAAEAQVRLIQQQASEMRALVSAIAGAADAFGLWGPELDNAARQLQQILSHAEDLAVAIASGNPVGIISSGISLAGDILGENGLGIINRNKDPGRLRTNRELYERALRGDLEALKQLEALSLEWATDRAKRDAAHLAEMARMRLDAQRQTEENNQRIEDEYQRELDALNERTRHAARMAEEQRRAAERHAEAVRRQREWESENQNTTADFLEDYARDTANDLDARRRAFAEAIEHRRRADALHRETITDAIERMRQAERDERAHRERLADLDRYWAEERERLAREAVQREEERLDRLRDQEERWVRGQEMATVQAELDEVLEQARKLGGGVGDQFARALEVYRRVLATAGDFELGEDSPIWRYKVEQAENELNAARRRVEDALQDRADRIDPGFTVQRTITAESAGRLVGEAALTNIWLQRIYERLGTMNGGLGRAQAAAGAADVSAALAREYQQEAMLQGNATLPM